MTESPPSSRRSPNVTYPFFSAESALDDLDLNDFGVSALERSLESSRSSVGVMLGTTHQFLKVAGPPVGGASADELTQSL